MTAKTVFLAGLLALLSQLGELRDGDAPILQNGARVMSPVRDVHVHPLKLSEGVVSELTISELKPLIAAFKVVQSAGVVKKSLENYRKQIEEDFMSTRDKLMARICGEAHDFKERLKSTIALAKKMGASVRRSSFLEIIANANGDVEDGIQYVEGMVRHLALSNSLTEQTMVEDSDEDTKRDYPLNLNDWKSFAYKKMQLYADELQIDSQSVGRIANFILKCIKEGMTALDSVESELKTHHKYPKEMDKKEKKMRRALGVGILYRDECAATD